jgi:hypothetical protein
MPIGELTISWVKAHNFCEQLRGLATDFEKTCGNKLLNPGVFARLDLIADFSVRITNTDSGCSLWGIAARQERADYAIGVLCRAQDLTRLRLRDA